jgi:hypothetical protein
MLDALYSSVKIIPPMGLFEGALCVKNGLKNTELFEIILARSPLFPKPHSPLQPYPVSRGYKGSAKGHSPATKNGIENNSQLRNSSNKIF